MAANRSLEYKVIAQEMLNLSHTGFGQVAHSGLKNRWLENGLFESQPKLRASPRFLCSSIDAMQDVDAMQDLELDNLDDRSGWTGDAIGRRDRAIARGLHHIGELTDWDYGEAWIPSPEGPILELHPACYITSRRSPSEVRAIEQFRICTGGLTFPPNVGLPGRVWASRQSEWLADAASQSERIFLRHHIAKAFGIKAGFGVPVLAPNADIDSSESVLAVLAFFRLEADADPSLTEPVSMAAMQLGAELASLLRDNSSQ